MKITSRKEAKENQLKHYFTGKVCKNKHLTYRFTASGGCLDCHKERVLKSYYSSGGKEKQKTEVIRQNKQRWRQRNKGVVNSWTAKRYTAKKQRTPIWISKEEIERIECYYKVAALYNKQGLSKWDVDHIIPLQGKTVSGLHVSKNLQVICKNKNIEKSNNWCWDTQQ
jgi:hypothetical protein